MYRDLDDVPWASWVPTMRATLVFVIREDGALLLIRKKRGLGAGKINGPGGRLDPGESPFDCAARELREEVGVEALALELRGELSFQFVDGLRLHAWVFVAPSHRGEAISTPEADPLWTAPDAIPYDEMWADDRLWLPVMLAGKRFRGRMLFDGDRMLGWAMEEDATLGDPRAVP
jgi:8-oxo-dGTP diphosphatase